MTLFMIMTFFSIITTLASHCRGCIWYMQDVLPGCQWATVSVDVMPHPSTHPSKWWRYKYNYARAVNPYNWMVIDKRWNFSPVLLLVFFSDTSSSAPIFFSKVVLPDDLLPSNLAVNSLTTLGFDASPPSLVCVSNAGLLVLPSLVELELFDCDFLLPVWLLFFLSAWGAFFPSTTFPEWNGFEFDSFFSIFAARTSPICVQGRQWAISKYLTEICIQSIWIKYSPIGLKRR